MLQIFSVPGCWCRDRLREHWRRRHLDLGHLHLLECQPPCAAPARAEIEIDVSARLIVIEV